MDSSFAQALRALMAERGISGRRLAQVVPCDNSLICRYRSGKQAPSAKMARLLDEALGADGKLAVLANPAPPSRRRVLAGGLLAGSLLAVGPEARELLAWADRHPPRIDGAVVDSLAELLTAQRRADDTLGSAAMLESALAQLAGVENLVRQAHGPVRPALLDIAQQWAQFAGWLSRNTADFAGAQAHIGRALGWAEELGDRTMISTLLENKSEIAVYCGEAGAVIGLAQAAQRDRRAAAGQRALAAEFEARGHAMAGDAVAADRKLGEAQDLAGALAGRPQAQRPWLYWLTPEFFQNEAGRVCAHLAADPRWHDRAITLLDTADKGSQVWVSAGNLTWLAFAHSQADEVEQACAVAMQASGAVRVAGSVRMARLLAQTCAGLQARYPADPRVAELADALA